MAITIRELARLLGVSEGTVDRALNDREGISYKTKKRVLDAARELNYIPNQIGRSLATGRSMTIGVICFDLYNNFFPQIIDTIERCAEEQGYFINLILSHRDLERELSGIRYLSHRHIDGIIIFPIGDGETYSEYLNSLQIPIVTLYNKISGGFSHVGVDDRNAMADAVRYIAQKGYRHIVYLTPPIRRQQERHNNVYTLHQRAEGYRDGMQSLDRTEQEIILEGKASFDHLEGYIRGDRTAFLCNCDSYALELFNYCREKGFQAPKDFGLMGYDNLDMLSYLQPRLTTVEYSVQKMGELAFHMLYGLINGSSSPSTHLLPYQIFPGETI